VCQAHPEYVTVAVTVNMCVWRRCAVWRSMWLSRLPQEGHTGETRLLGHLGGVVLLTAAVYCRQHGILICMHTVP
jgi:NhaP-type Na+/H+ or K+/H+ antiporter